MAVCRSLRQSLLIIEFEDLCCQRGDAALLQGFLFHIQYSTVQCTPYSIGTYPTITNIVYGKAVGQGFLFSCSTNIKPWGRVSFFMFNKHLYGIMPPVRQCVTFSCIINIINGSAAEMQSFYVRGLF